MDYLIVIILGIFSGILSGFSLNEYAITLELGPGLVFGFIFGLYFLYKYSFSLYKAIAWVLASEVSWYIAFRLGMIISIMTAHKSIIDDGYDIGAAAYVIAGTIGAFLVALSFSFLVNKIRFLHIIYIASLGGVLSLSGVGSEPSFLLFIVWQTGVAFGLYVATKLNVATLVYSPSNSTETPSQVIQIPKGHNKITKFFLILLVFISIFIFYRIVVTNRVSEPKLDTSGFITIP